MPMGPGRIERRAHDLLPGTTSLSPALDTLTGELPDDYHRRHRSIELREYLDTLVCL